MVSFLTLFLGLIAGPHAVEVSVAGPAASVEIRLDGRAVGLARKAPWTLTVDFGSELAPHELEARALDQAGGEIGRVRQWVNLPRPPAEVQIMLERDERGMARFARLDAESLFGPTPQSLSASFDGTAVAVGAQRRIDLPPYDPQTTHLLTVTADFPNGVRSRRDLVVGGTAASAVASELTAVAVRWTSGAPPQAASFSGSLMREGAALPVVAVEHGPAQVFLVRDLSCDEAVARLGRGGRTLIDPTRNGAMPLFDPEATRTQMRLDPEDRVRFLWPRARVVSSANPPTELFDTSHDFTARDGGLHWLLTHVDHPARVEPHPRFADAVAIAGLQAIGSHGRRAVILILGKNGRDESRYAPETVRRYLASLGVPLYVWSLEKAASTSPSALAGHWGQPQDISSLPKLRAAFERFRRDLDDQWTVWLAGEHRPQDIALQGGPEGVELVR